MKKITDFRKLLGVNEFTSLLELKSLYRAFMKDWHPDKFTDSNLEQKVAEEKSKAYIEAYHFLVSIASETRKASLVEYQNTTTQENLKDYQFKSQVLIVEFTDGSSYEYFDVPKAVYTKLVNADSPGRFARRHIFNSYIYRSTSKIANSV